MSYFDKHVAVRMRLEDMVERRNQVVALVDHGLKALNEAGAIMNALGCLGLPPEARDVRHGYLHTESIERGIDREMWRVAFKRTGLTQIMDDEAVKAFERELEKTPPRFDMANIRSTFVTMSQTADDMFARGVYNVFRKLDRHYRTNELAAFKVQPKAILTWMATWWMGYAQLNYRRDGIVNDLDRVLCVLDGKPHRPHALEGAVNAAWKACEPFDGEHLKLVPFKNGNAHLTLKRLDLIDKVNDLIAAYCGGNAIPEGGA